MDRYFESAPWDSCALYRTPTGVVGAHVARTEEGIAVCSVIGSPLDPPGRVFKGVYEVALSLVGRGPAEAVNLFELEVVEPTRALRADGPG